MYVFLRFENAITLARSNIFSLCKKFLVAGISLYHKQPKRENCPRTPAPLNGRLHNCIVLAGGRAIDYVIILFSKFYQSKPNFKEKVVMLLVIAELEYIRH